jgi:hypothetical protein
VKRKVMENPDFLTWRGCRQHKANLVGIWDKSTSTLIKRE